MQFTEQDQDQIRLQGISLDQIEQQIQHFVHGFPYLNVIKAATIGDGIVRVPDEQLGNYLRRFDEAAHERDLVKFVPASGAATRMFKSLFAALDGKSDKSTWWKAQPTPTPTARCASILPSRPNTGNGLKR